MTQGIVHSGSRLFLNPAAVGYHLRGAEEPPAPATS
eukprot:CAMPEP_0171106900 /NCGR_PEP_ID=MMETSP0766_2-20121228/65769_1 /TAXON_ID=439317 /ORGANISM="Gambierdiscus australes, Strain CAWD 149" /LENGTH=35 /DNA_ID= /DNA_START= /DNA_END= /DNA_ORIENTATION=